ncbi:MAG TPA: RagB/SusD family nutrient uptake outer membrane protein [Chitinophaga sp.]
MHILNQQLSTIYRSQLLRMALLFCIMPACKKFIEVPLPGTEIFPEDVYDSDLTASGAVTGIYGYMINNNAWASGNTQSVTFLCALSADELENYSSELVPREFYENAIKTNNAAVENAFWDPAYLYIYAANAVLEGLDRSPRVSSATKKQLQGEALFIRAFCHFYLVNLFGPVPYLDSTAYEDNIVRERTPVSTVYQQIITDLRAAQEKLNAEYVRVERVRPNKWAATALLARVFLYAGNWKEAEAQATAVIAQSAAYHLDSLNGVFLKNSKETIWQLMPNNSEAGNTWEGKNFILNAAPSTGESNAAILSQQLLNAFESGDHRRSAWVDSIASVDRSRMYFFPYKYKIQNSTELQEYSMVLRLAELYLVRAEARAQQGKISGAKADLNMIRKRAGLPTTTADSRAALLGAIAHEREVELFTEWGHRWLDLKRTGTADAVLGTVKAPGWQTTDALYPIPENERAQNPELTQNPGYN